MAGLRRRLFCLLAVTSLFLSLDSGALGAVEADAPRIIALEPGAVLVLDDALHGSTRVKLQGLLIPTAPPALVASIETFLREIVVGRTVEATGWQIDRHHRLLAQIHLDSEDWLQGDLIGRGFARVLFPPDADGPYTEMLAHEDRARRNKLGLWAHPDFRVLNADRVRAPLGSYQLVSGRIRDVAEVRKRTYMNFGEDWRSDFTIIMEPALRRRYLALGKDPADLKGRRVRVRGWLQSYNGPMIRIIHPLEIEILDENTTGI